MLRNKGFAFAAVAGYTLAAIITAKL